MHHTSILAATGAEPTSVLDALPYLTGMLIVLITLAALWGVCVITAKLVKIEVIFRKKGADSPAPSSTPPPSPVAATPVPAAEAEAIAPEIVAAIAAAVACCVGSAHRVVSIKRQSTTWEKAGRQSVLTSHRIR